MRWRELRILAFDTETTGLYPEEGHRVIEFAAVELRLDAEGKVADVVRHEWMFNPGVPIPRDVTEVNHIRDEDVADKPAFSVSGGAIHALLTGSLLVAHNLPFDQRFLTAEFGRLGLRWPVTAAEVDTSDLSRLFFKEARSHKLGELCTRLDVPLVEAHRAGNDAEACGRGFLVMADRFDAPAELEGLGDWGDVILDPPATGHMARNGEGVLAFLEGAYEGQAVEAHPEILAWIGMARERREGRWDWRFPEQLRRWSARWLRVRAAGRFPQHMKGFGPLDWGIDPPLGAAAAAST
ncbi:hypothetical protein LBMAG42_49740 [Deltaproteobacteria bacterium]|nr:hypothetical protein LBMAG42_49740 [Deltaproteobacteria bacterium]